MNDSFERIAEPIKFDGSLVNTTEGIVANLNGLVGILDKNLTIAKPIETNSGTLSVENSNKEYDNYIYFTRRPKNTVASILYWAYDLKENRFITFYK